MALRRVKLALAAVFSVFSIFFSISLFAQEDTHVRPKEEHGVTEDKHESKKSFDAAEVIFGHILDNHEYHFTEYHDAEGNVHHVSIPLPIILYSKERGLTAFMSSRFEHGHADFNGYRIGDEKIVAVKEDGSVDEGVKVYDLSITRNVVQMSLALIILCWLMISIAKSYRKGLGVKTAPKGKQNLLEPVVIFVRDEVAKPNLGHKYEKYLPYLLTTFFFILINNIFGLIPGTANVTGNIAFTVVLGLISFVVILFSTNSHFWGHIFNPPGVPGFVKPILILVEFLGVFIKPFALIIRLFANMVAGHIIIICLISLIFIFGQMNSIAGWGTSPVAIAFTVFIYFIEVLVAFLQAFIFTNLTAVFIGSAFEGGHDHEGEHIHV
ncbi:MAG: F0F1 ATP synthase subunit A [Chitinophagaceae bacterium]|nr:F0F1 ATP synthase subunit A [Chitinophagaceae bacterium]